MTMLEFEAWVSDHRDEMERYARSRVNGYGVSPEDVVNNTLIRLMVKDGGKRVAKIYPHAIKAYVWFALRSVAANALQEDQRRRDREIAYHSDEAHSTPSFTRETSLLALAKQGKPAAMKFAAQFHTEDGEQVAFKGAPDNGIGRWKYQQRRDAKLFDAIAVQSLSKSIRGVSRRYRHISGLGVSFVLYGREVAGGSSQHLDGEVPWTQVTGHRFLRDGGRAMSYDVTLDPEPRDGEENAR